MYRLLLFIKFVDCKCEKKLRDVKYSARQRAVLSSGSEYVHCIFRIVLSPYLALQERREALIY